VSSATYGDINGRYADISQPQYAVVGSATGKRAGDETYLTPVSAGGNHYDDPGANLPNAEYVEPNGSYSPTYAATGAVGAGEPVYDVGDGQRPVYALGAACTEQQHDVYALANGTEVGAEVQYDVAQGNMYNDAVYDTATALGGGGTAGGDHMYDMATMKRGGSAEAMYDVAQNNAVYDTATSGGGGVVSGTDAMYDLAAQQMDDGYLDVGTESPSAQHQLQMVETDFC
jgi:hypothetical protein